MSEARTTENWKRRIGTAAGMLLGLVLIVAAVGKAMDPILFAQQLRNEGLVGILSANTMMLIALGLEMGLGAALLLGIRHRWVLFPTAILVSFFLFLTGRNFLLILLGHRDPSYECGCFGVLFERTGTEAFWQDLLILLAPLLLAYWKRPTNASFPAVRAVSALVAAGAIIFYTVGVVGLPPSEHTHEGMTAAASFQPAEEYLLFIDGEARHDDRVYQSENLELLIVSPELHQAVLLDIRTGKVSLAAHEAVRAESGGSEIERDQFREAGSFTVGLEGLTLEILDHRLELRNRPAGSE